MHEALRSVVTSRRGAWLIAAVASACSRGVAVASRRSVTVEASRRSSSARGERRFGRDASDVEGSLSSWLGDGHDASTLRDARSHRLAAWSSRCCGLTAQRAWSRQAVCEAVRALGCRRVGALRRCGSGRRWAARRSRETCSARGLRDVGHAWPPNKAMKLTRLAAAPGRMRQGAAAWPRGLGTGATASQLIAGVLRT